LPGRQITERRAQLSFVGTRPAAHPPLFHGPITTR
jgi:hypothetical protein